MAVFSSLSSFFNRHKRKILIASILSASAYYAVDYFVIRKFRDFQDSLRRDYMSKKQIEQRFLQTQEDCFYTVLALLPVLTGPISEELPVEAITQALRMKKSASKNENRPSELTTDNLSLLENNNSLENSNVYFSKSKAELWDLLKVKTITRILVLFYSVSGLFLITKLQLNILGRRSYLESAISMAGVKQSSTSWNDINSQENYVTEQSYLSLSWWLLNKGWKNLHNIIEPVVAAKFAKSTPKTELSIIDFDNLLLEIINEISFKHTSVSDGTTSASNNIYYNLFPIQYDDLVETLLNTNPDVIHQLDNPVTNFSKLVSETKLKILKSDEFDQLFTNMVMSNLDTLKTNLISGLIGINPLNSSSFLLDPDAPNQPVEPKVQDISELDKSFKLANFLAQLSVQNGIILDNDYLSKHAPDEELQGLMNTINAGANGGFSSGNDYINRLNELHGLHEFSASVYSCYE